MLTAGPYLAAFQLLADDFRTAQQYVEPSDANLGTYSHRLYELLLRACTEFESVCKHLLLANGSRKPSADMNINDYKTLESELPLESKEVGILSWSPAPAYVQPFKNWSTAAPPLSWYSDYNRVKHDRQNEFSRAHLSNVRVAIAAQFVVLSSSNLLVQTFGTKEVATTGGRRERIYAGYQFSLVL
jgi:hypothetical protein